MKVIIIDELKDYTLYSYLCKTRAPFKLISKYTGDVVYSVFTKRGCTEWETSIKYTNRFWELYDMEMPELKDIEKQLEVRRRKEDEFFAS